MTYTSHDLIDDLFTALVRRPSEHPTDSTQYQEWRDALAPVIKDRFANARGTPAPFGPLGPLSLPYFEMGAITSLELFGLDELILFAFYYANRSRYRRVVDFGTNIGLHTIMMARCGFEVRSFEPDPIHIAQLRENLWRNDVQTDLRQAAVSLEDGQAEFVRVKGNTTGSHIGGAKADPYGDLDRFKVDITAAAPHLHWADLAKIDIEGHEATLIKGLPPETWLNTDAMMEIGTPENAKDIFDHLSGTQANMFSQKRGWGRVEQLEDVPTSHREGSVFLTGKSQVPWGAEG